jgi:DNA-binding transcriptional regulator YiaG
MSNGRTSNNDRDTYGMTPDDWERLAAMTDEDIVAAALSDPDAQPIPVERLATASRPLCKVVRYKLKMGRETFAAAYGIPLETLVSWERGHAQPTPTELAYLRVIEREPEITKIVELAKAS